MDHTMKVAAASLILVTILNGLNIVSIHNELAAAGVILGGALAACHFAEGVQPLTRRLRRWRVARLRRMRRPTRKD